MRKIRTRALSILSVGLITLFSQTASAQAGGDAGHGVNSQAESGAGHAKRNQFWWPRQLDLSSLRDHDARSNPLGSDFDYAEAFKDLDLAAVKADINVLLTDSQD